MTVRTMLRGVLLLLGALTGALPPSAPCGTATDLSVKIVNQGFVTARLEAELIKRP